MWKKGLIFGIVLLMVSFFAATLMAQSNVAQQEFVADVPFPTDQLIIHFAESTDAAVYLAPDSNGYLTALSDAAGVQLAYVREMSGNAHVLKLPERMPIRTVIGISEKLSGMKDVVHVEPDYIKMPVGNTPDQPQIPFLVPNDPAYANQWHYAYTAGTSEGLNLPQAWNITTGSASVVVAVVDTGILNHADLAGRTVAGYDFIHDVAVANDGNGRDNDPADPGDWVTTDECGYPHGPQDSSWHGTHVAGTIGAASNNNLGVAGVNWNAKILPVRVLGKCGGYTSDIVDGVRWAAGLSVTGVPANANPAKVINLSLGGPGTCSSEEQSAYDAVTAAGTTVVVAAGNDNANAANYSPASCNNVITVASTNRNGNRSYYSNYGSVVEVSAPGGETYPTPTNGVLSTLDGGTTVPLNDNAYAYYQGTSMASPHVAGVVSLIVGQHPEYTPSQVLLVLSGSTRPFPNGSTCTTSICGSGIVDAYQALTMDLPESNVFLPMITQQEPTPPPGCTPQSGESNNISDALLTCSGTTSSGQVSDGDLDDVYKIQMEANQHLTISMNGSGGDADLYLFAPDATNVNTDAPTAYSATDGNNELISGQVLVGGYWYIDVYSYSGTTNYNVTVTVSNALQQEEYTFTLSGNGQLHQPRQNR